MAVDAIFIYYAAVEACSNCYMDVAIHVCAVEAMVDIYGENVPWVPPPLFFSTPPLPNPLTCRVEAHAYFVDKEKPLWTAHISPVEALKELMLID